jgi:hypothetical protein
MNNKQRVLATIDHIEPERVPVDLWALSPVTDRLREHFGIESEGLSESAPSSSQGEGRGGGDDESVWQALGVDLRSVWPDYAAVAYL